MAEGNSEAAARTGSRYAHLDGLRGLAAFVVLLHHCVNMFDLALTTGHPHQGYGRLDALLSGMPFMLMNAGNFCVCIFFCLSGFVLALAFSRSRLNAAGLVAKRYVRLAVPMLATCLISYVLLSGYSYRNTAVAAYTSSDWAATQFLQTPDLLSAISEGAWRDLIFQAPGSSSYNSTLWTMQVEFGGSLFMILLIAALRFWLKDADAVRTWGLRLFIVSAVLFWSTYLMPFSIGAALYFAELRQNAPTTHAARTGRRTVCYAGLGALALFLGTIPYSAQPTLAVEPFAHAPSLPQAVPLPLIDAQAFWHVIGAACLLFMVQTSGLLRRILGCRLCRWFGDISFPLYLIHVPVLCSAGGAAYLFAIGNGHSPGVAIAAAVLVTITVSLTLAHLAVHIIERPSIALSDRAGRAVAALLAPVRLPRLRTRTG